jgi:hypothetical protein
MKVLLFLFTTAVLVCTGTPVSAQLLIYKGTLKQSALGQGASEKLNSSLYLIIDHSTANTAQILYSTSGRTKVYHTLTDTNLHIVQVAGAKGKTTEAIAHLANSCDVSEGSTSDDVLAEGADSLLTVNVNTTVTFPKVLSGSSKVISYDTNTPTYVESTLVASFDAPHTLISNEAGDTLDAAVARMSNLLGGLGYTNQVPGQQIITGNSSPIVITNDTMVTTWSDSFARGDYGQRQNFFIGSYFINYYPQHFISFRDHSRSGDSNFGMLTEREPQYGIPDAGASYGKTNGLNLFYVSENGGYGSNSIYGMFKEILQYPTNAYNRFGTLTHDWSQANPAHLYSSIVIGDIPYYTVDGRPFSRDYSYGGRSAASEDRVPFVDSWANLVNVVTNGAGGYPANSNLWFNAPAYDHPANELQLCWALTTLRSLGVDSNTYTAVINFHAATVSSTNHCSVTGLSRNGNGITFTFHADRMAPGFYVPDNVVTNDCRGAFALMPELGNQFREILQIPDIPSGNYNLNIDGSNVVTLSSAQLAAGYNSFTNYSGPFWAQKEEVLGLMCDMADVLRSDASIWAHPGDNRLMVNYESMARGRWPTNNFGVVGYIAQMSDCEAQLQAEDILIHAAAQQTNHIFTLTPVP